MSRRLTVGPFNRVEGDLEVRLDIDAGKVRAAFVNSPMYRGFEPILIGKSPLDALVVVPRICGICSVAQSVAAAAALASAAGIVVPANGRHAQNLILAGENVADHLTHFYCFFMPDFAREAYAARPWHAATARRFKALSGAALADALPARAGLLRLLAYLAGKWPHSLALQPGGTTRAVTATEKVRLAMVLREFRAFLETTLFGDTLEAVAALASPAALARWAAGRDADFPRFLALADDLGLGAVGRGSDAYLSYGAYASSPTEALFRAGVWDGGWAEFDAAQVAEDVSHAWLAGAGAQPPFAGATEPLPDKAGAYTWCKAPRYAGRVVETGALARQLMAGQPLVAGLVAAGGGSVLARVVARMLEVARVVSAMDGWLGELAPGEPFCAEWTAPQEGQGVGLIEAARGSLGHWLRIEQGRIAGYQIVAPTTWNFSPRDAAGTPGALEQALAGLAVGEAERNPVAVQHVVRSFDPCMACTVH